MKHHGALLPRCAGAVRGLAATTRLFNERVDERVQLTHLRTQGGNTIAVRAMGRADHTARTARSLGHLRRSHRHRLVLELARVVRAWSTAALWDAPHFPAALAAEIYNLDSHHHCVDTRADASIAALPVRHRASACNFNRPRGVGYLCHMDALLSHVSAVCANRIFYANAPLKPLKPPTQ